jgi:hypothetical protein
MPTEATIHLDSAQLGKGVPAILDNRALNSEISAKGDASAATDPGSGHR